MRHCLAAGWLREGEGGSAIRKAWQARTLAADVSVDVGSRNFPRKRAAPTTRVGSRGRIVKGCYWKMRGSTVSPRMKAT
jgi:hypothetical protein